MEKPKKVRIHQIVKDDIIRLSCYKTKEELLEKLNLTSFGFEVFLKNRDYCSSNGRLDCNLIDVLIQIISDACTVSLERLKGRRIRFLKMLKDCKQFIFVDVLHVLNTVLIDSKPSINLVLFSSRYLMILENLMKFCECPEILNDAFPTMQNYFNAMSSRRLKNFEEVKLNFAKLKRIVELKESYNINEPRSDLDEIKRFRQLAIVPREDDVTNCEVKDLPHNIIDAPYEEVDHYLGVHFLLMREDMLRSFRECVRICLDNYENPSQLKMSSIRMFPNVFIKPPAKFTKRGITYELEITSKTDVNWTKKDTLMPGNMVCLTPNKFHKVIFATVTREAKAEKDICKKCTVKVKLEDDLYQDELLFKQQYLMLEPSAFFECYKHVLTSIKSFSCNSFPLADVLVYLECNESSPEYLRDPEADRGKKYHLELKKDSDDGEEDTENIPQKEFEPLNLEEWPSAEELGLDEQQHKAFQLALTNKVAVIQGPPGTGKTFIGKKIVKVLLDNKLKTPIIICCLTNHALDQFLEGILQYTKNIIRLGSQSKSEIIEAFTLNNLIDTLNVLKQEKHNENHFLKTSELSKKALAYLKMYHPMLLQNTTLDKSGDANASLMELKITCRELNGLITKLNLCEFMYLEDSGLNNIIKKKEMDQLKCGSTTHGSKLITSVLEWLASSRKSDLYEQCEKRFAEFKRNKTSHHYKKKVSTLWALGIIERLELFYEWREKALTDLKKEIEILLETYRKKMIEGVKIQPDSNKIDILKGSYIIGVTTTGAAKYKDLLQFTEPSIMIVEEAAEVLESHIIASLLPTLQHLILIGDHKQLRPLPACHELGEVYNLKISMFERLFNNDCPSATLVYQHRMKPCIAELLVNEYLYEDLKSYENVYKYEEIKGLKSSMFFFNHSIPEADHSSSTSSFNKDEARMTVSLAKYLLMQSYSPEQITILATYAAQVNCISNLLCEAQMEDVKLTTVDNYQGEENDIILVSFVRNNRDGIIGFLREDNRVCVALSRARKGMFCLGNFTMYANKSPLWRSIVSKLEAQNMIGDKFPLFCSRHGTESYAQNLEDISNFMNGGCQEICNFKLSCGHTCTKKCHLRDAEHLKYQCKLPCEQFIGDGIKCPRLCFQKCKTIKKDLITLDCGHQCRPKLNQVPVCYEEIPKKLPCNHLVTIPCNTDLSKYRCKAAEMVILKCRHDKVVPCYRKSKLNFVVCHEKVPVTAPCGHTVEVECNLSNLTPSDLLAYCTKSCDSLLSCGHPCSGDCKFCFEFGIHALCTAGCTEKLRCGHPCDGLCNSECVPCTKKCEMICSHEKRCINNCYRPCIECHEVCALRCKHVKCSKLCFEECDAEPCSQICREMLSCGHQCIGLCNDECPYLCRVCNEEDLKSGNPKQDRYVMLNDCDHVVEVNKLTEHIENCLFSYQWPNCPMCSKPIYKSLRYKNYLLKAREHVFQFYNTTEIMNDVQYHLHTSFDEDYLIPAKFLSVENKIRRILNGNPTKNILIVLKESVLNLKKLVKIYEKLNRLPENDSNRNGIRRFEVLLLWLSNHLDYASWQQIHEAEVAVDELNFAVDAHLNYRENPLVFP